MGKAITLIPVIHNVSSVQRLVDIARIVISLDLEFLAASKVYGAAAQSGIAEAFRILLRERKGLVVLPELRDVVKAYSPDQVLLIDKDNASRQLELEEFKDLKGKVMVVLNGSDAPFAPQELSLGEPVYIRGLKARAGAVAEGALILYALSTVEGGGPTS
ncbi:MAG: RecB-family nuclease [Acidilobus sp.]